MAINLDYALTLCFRILVSSYFISLGVNWQQSSESSLSLLNSNLSQYRVTRNLVLEAWHLSIYAHLNVIGGVALLFGWRVGKILGGILLLVNYSVLRDLNEDCFIGLKVMMLGLVIAINLKKK